MLFFLQERRELFFKTEFMVMLCLRIDIGNRCGHLRYAQRKRTITFLPLQPALELFVHPLGRSTFDQLHCLGDRHCRRNREQYVNMVIRAADGQRFHSVVTGNAADVGPEVRLYEGGDCSSSFFGRKHAMY